MGHPCVAGLSPMATTASRPSQARLTARLQPQPAESGGAPSLSGSLLEQMKQRRFGLFGTLQIAFEFSSAPKLKAWESELVRRCPTVGKIGVLGSNAGTIGMPLTLEAAGLFGTKAKAAEAIALASFP